MPPKRSSEVLNISTKSSENMQSAVSRTKDNDSPCSSSSVMEVDEDEERKSDPNVSPKSTSSAKENSAPKRKKGSSINRNLTMSYTPKRRKRPSSAGSAAKSEVPDKRGRGRPPSSKSSVVSESKESVSDKESGDEPESCGASTVSSSDRMSTTSSTLRANRRGGRNTSGKGVEEALFTAAGKVLRIGDGEDTGCGSSVTSDSNSNSSKGTGGRSNKKVDEKESVQEIVEMTDVVDEKKPGDSDAEEMLFEPIIKKVEKKKPVKQDDKKADKAQHESDQESEESSSSGSETESEGEGDSDDDPDKEVYVVERIDDKKIIEGTTFYFIKWKGWNESSNTWEPLENLDGCSELLDEFEKRYAEKHKTRRRTTGGGRSKRKDDIDEALEETQSHMRNYGILAEWPGDKEPLSVEGVIHVDGVLTYVVKRKVRLGSKKLDRSNAVLVYADGFKMKYPDLVIDFYQSRVVWTENAKNTVEQAYVASELALLRQNAGSALGKIIANDMDRKLRDEYKDTKGDGKEAETETQTITLSDNEDEAVKEDSMEENTQLIGGVKSSDNFGLPEDMEETDISSCVSEPDLEELNLSKLSKKERNEDDDMY